jgi:hypothetical protein
VSSLRAVLLDVGGTLWPDRLGSRPDLETEIHQQLRTLLPNLDPVDTLRVLRSALQADSALLVQRTHGQLARALDTLGCSQ